LPVIRPLAILLIVAATALLATLPAGSTVPGSAGPVAFHSDRLGNYEIYVMNPDGTHQARLTYSTEDDVDPAFSPDGTKIAFASSRIDSWDIYVMNADGSDATNITDHGATDTAPAFSPDGSRIAFVSDRDGGSEIYVMGADGSAPTRLTTNAAHDGEPVFSPDGSQIAFTSLRIDHNTTDLVVRIGTSVAPGAVPETKAVAGVPMGAPVALNMTLAVLVPWPGFGRKPPASGSSGLASSSSKS